MKGRVKFWGIILITRTQMPDEHFEGIKTGRLDAYEPVRMESCKISLKPMQCTAEFISLVTLEQILKQPVHSLRLKLAKNC